MKEAAGEANMTVITIVLIGVVAAVGAILVPKILEGSEKKAACAEMGGNLSGKICTYKDFSTIRYRRMPSLWMLSIYVIYG